MLLSATPESFGEICACCDGVAPFVCRTRMISAVSALSHPRR